MLLLRISIWQFEWAESTEVYPEKDTGALSLPLRQHLVSISICMNKGLRHHRDLELFAISIDLQKSIVGVPGHHPMSMPILTPTGEYRQSPSKKFPQEEI